MCVHMVNVEVILLIPLNLYLTECLPRTLKQFLLKFEAKLLIALFFHCFGNIFMRRYLIA